MGMWTSKEITKAVGLGIIGIMSPRFFIGAGIPLDKWATKAGEYSASVGAVISPDTLINILGIMFGIILITIEWWLHPLSKIYLRFKKNPLSTQYAQECENLANEIKEFIYERETSSPPFFPDNENDLRENSYDRFKKQSDHSKMTGAIYAKKFTGRLHDLINYLKENGHQPSRLLTHGDDAWADKKIGSLITYARLLREGKTINDEEGS